jgi:aspartate 1-decarboxylase
MLLKLMKGKIHRATVTQAELDYVGSITIDADLMDAAGLLPNEAVTVADVNNGTRHETYTIAGPRGSGMICVNGAAARLVSVGDSVIIFAFAMMSPEEAETHKAKVVLMNPDNTITDVLEA